MNSSTTESKLVLPRLYSITEVAAHLGGVSKWTVRAWVSQGRLRRTKVGSRTMISEDDLTMFLRVCNGTKQTPKRSNTRR
jgi:excisionase family DNA binding protein